MATIRLRREARFPFGAYTDGEDEREYVRKEVIPPWADDETIEIRSMRVVPHEVDDQDREMSRDRTAEGTPMTPEEAANWAAGDWLVVYDWLVEV